MAIFNCKSCGGDLEIREGTTVVTCEYCGRQQTVPSLDNEKKVNLFNRANRLRSRCDFDKAASVYESIVAEFPTESEAYWGLCLCKFGIEYVDDPATANKIPTCHRTSYESIFDDSNFDLACENADALAVNVYRKEAKEIDRLQKEILEIVKNEKPFDVFICYKESDEMGGRTVDSELAHDIYDVLTEKGYKVFYSRITLKSKLGQDYEPYIFSALNSAKVMLAIGTKFEYFNAVWVKNEWSRFLSIMKSDKSKMLIPCYRDIDPYDMPREFSNLQGQDLSSPRAFQDLVTNIERLIPKATAQVVQSVVTAASPSTEPLIKRAFMCLEDGDWDGADKCCEKILDIDPENPQAYLAKLMAAYKLHNRRDLGKLKSSFAENINYKKIMKFGDDEIKNEVEGYIQEIAQAIKDEEERKIQQEREAQQARKAQLDKEFEALPGRVAAAQSYYDLASVKADLAKFGDYDQNKLCEILRACNARFKEFNSCIRKPISAGSFHTVAIRNDRTVAAAGKNDNGQCNVSDWNDIVEVACGDEFTIGLTSLGEVRFAGTIPDDPWGRERPDKWTNIVTLSVLGNNVAGLTSGGEVKLYGTVDCEIEDKRIVDVSVGCNHYVALFSDGTAEAFGDDRKMQTRYVHAWKNVDWIYASCEISMGFRRDGKIYMEGIESKGAVKKWKNIVSICGVSQECRKEQINVDAVFVWYKTNYFGLTSEGKVLHFFEFSESNEIGQSLTRVDYWSNIIAISAGRHHVVGLQADGKLVTVGTNEFGQCDISGWDDIVIPL